jgi:histidinol-phosphatase (PHP family)
LIPVDYHLHTNLCGHATGEIDDYLEQALKLGIEEIGFSDHYPLYFLSKEETIPNYAMSESQLPLYVDMVQQLAKAAPIKVKLGIEVDYVPGYEKELAGKLTAYPFDYITGAVHFIDGWGFDNPAEIDGYRNRKLYRIYEQYFSLIQQAAETGIFDIIAHPDLVKKFGFTLERDLTPLYEETARVFKQANVCAEVNTAGLRYPAGEIYPSLAMLEILHRYDVPVTLGSDAHTPEQVGCDLKNTLQLVKAVGYSEIAFFEQRKRRMIRI